MARKGLNSTPITRAEKPVNWEVYKFKKKLRAHGKRKLYSIHFQAENPHAALTFFWEPLKRSVSKVSVSFKIRNDVKVEA